MLHFEKYENQVPFPLKKDFTEIEFLVSKTGKRVENKIFHEDVYNKAVLDRIHEQDFIIGEFKKDLIKDLKIENHPKSDLLVEMAWQYGHLNGLKEIYNYARDLVDLIR